MISLKDKAIRNIYPDVVTVRNADEENCKALDSNNNLIALDNTLVQNEVNKLQVEYDAQDYARKRKAEYPSTKDFMEAYTEKEIGGDSTKWDAYVINYNKVRTENPK